MAYIPESLRYEGMMYRRSGRSGLRLPLISLGLWHSFGAGADSEAAAQMIRSAFDLGITHFDLANNYGPPPGSAEQRFGQIFARDLAAHRDELIISTKAGYTMWEGPYGDWGSRKYLVASLDQSLRRMGIDYVDIFYHHRRDPETPLEETMAALDHIVRSGKALYAGISNYDTESTKAAVAILRRLGTPCLIHQVKYSMLNRVPETSGLLSALGTEGVGIIAFSPLAQGILSGKYSKGIPSDSRAAGPSPFLKTEQISPELSAKVVRLQQIAEARGQSLAQMALAWVLRDQSSRGASQVTSVLIGASRASQIVENVATIKKLDFSDDELSEIDAVLS